MTEYRYSKEALAKKLALTATMDGWNHEPRFHRKHPALSEDEMPGRLLTKMMNNDPELRHRVKTLKAEHFSVRF